MPPPTPGRQATRFQYAVPGDLAGEVIGAFDAGLRAGQSPVEAFEAARASVRQADAASAPGAWAGWLLISGR